MMVAMSLAIFDLDNTLISGDSDYLWGEFLVEQGIVDRNYYEKTNAQFYDDYCHGTLDIEKFLHFALTPLAENNPEQLFKWRTQFLEKKIKPIMLSSAKNLIQQHRASGDTLLVVTATNQFVTEPIVELYGIPNLIATIPEFKNGRFTGDFSGIPCFQKGKIQRLEQWLKNTTHSCEDSWFYSDSHNDLPLLEYVRNPVAVDPDAKLRKIAMQKDWPIISLRGNEPPIKLNQ